MNILNIAGTVIATEAVKTPKDALIATVKRSADLTYANLTYAKNGREGALDSYGMPLVLSRKSNLLEFPNDGSSLCEERVAAFEFTKAAALRMKIPKVNE